MKIGSPQLRIALAFVFIGVLFTLNGCTNSPEGLDRWANRPGSEELFIKRLQDPKMDDATRAHALELLVEQWRYSADLVRKDVISDIPEENGRERVVAKAIPQIEKYFKTDDKTQRIQTRDAIYTVRKQVTSQENIDKLDGLLIGWLQSDWTANPCEEIGTTRASGIFNTIGQKKGEPILVGVFDEGSWEKTYCALTNTDNVEWRNESTQVAEALLGFWDRGIVPEDMQNQVTYFDFLYTFAKLPAVRKWSFSKMRDEKISENHRGIITKILAKSATEEDLPMYKDMLNNTDIYRWEALRVFVHVKGAAGLDEALSALPEESDYAYWNKARRLNGLKSAADFVCTIGEIEDPENTQDMKAVFLKHAKGNAGNIWSRAISTYCLGYIGDESDFKTLESLKSSGDTSAMVSFWSSDANNDAGAVTIKEVIDDTIEKLKETLLAKKAEEDAENTQPEEP